MSKKKWGKMRFGGKIPVSLFCDDSTILFTGSIERRKRCPRDAKQ
jgi:hypothetical protein